MARVALELEVNGSGRTPRPGRGLTQQQRKRLDRALFRARHPYGAVAIAGVLYLAILVGAVGELIHGSYLGVTWVLYGVAGFAVAAGLTALAALAGRRGPRPRPRPVPPSSPGPPGSRLTMHVL
jgi:hypothetical protein